MRGAFAMLATLGVLGAGGLVWARGRSEPSPGPAPAPALPALRVASGGVHPLHPARIEETAQRLARTVLGQPYSWGGGRHAMGWPQGWEGVHGGKGWDCGGLVQAWSALLLRYRWEDRDRGARELDELCSPVALGSQQVGDLAVYKGRHVTAVVSAPNPATGHSVVISASGGTSQTNGNDPNATVRLQSKGNYRSDFLRYVRLPPVNVSDAQAVTCMAVHRLLAGEAIPDDPRLPLPRLRDELQRRYAGLPVVADWLSKTAHRDATVSGWPTRRNANATQGAWPRRLA